MPRQLDNTEYYRKITDVSLYTIQSGTIGDTTTTGSNAAGAATCNVTAITNFTNGDPVFIIGDGGFELNAINGTVATAMPMARKLLFTQAAGARFVEAVRKQLGRIEVSGVTFSPSRTNTAIEAADIDPPMGYIDGTLELGGSFSMLGFNPENFAVMCGFAENVTGTGTSADPYQMVYGATNQAVLSNICFRVTGLRGDGKTFEFDFLNCRIEVQGQVQMGKNAVAAIPVSVKAGHTVKRYWT